MNKLLFFLITINLVNVFSQECNVESNNGEENEKILAYLNIEFDILKKDILDLNSGDKVGLLVHLLQEFDITIDLNKINFNFKYSTIEKIMQNIENFCALLTSLEFRPFHDYLIFIRNHPEKCGMYWSNAFSSMSYVSESVKKIQKDTYKAFYIILYNDLTQNRQNLSTKINTFIYNNFPQHKLFSANFIRSIA